MEERFIDLETRLAFQEQAIHELSEVVARQQGEIVALTAQLLRMHERLRAMQPSDIARPDEETPPPHY